MRVFIADVYAQSQKAAEKRPKKLYFWEEGLRRALTLDRHDGKAAENVAAWHMIKKGRESKPFFEPYYWKNKHEIDFVYDDSKKVIPVEIKYMKDLKNGIVVTKDTFRKEDFAGRWVLFIPIWLFLQLV